MRTCLLISGLPRNIERGYPGILQSIILPNDPDIFIHTWLDIETNKSTSDMILEMFKPKKYIMEPQKIFKNTFMNVDRMVEFYARFYGAEKFVEMLHSSWYSIQQCNILKEQYRLENNIKYDCVIRARFDIDYSHTIDCKNYTDETIYISNRANLPEKMIDDRFAFGPNHLMNIYCSGFNLLDYIFNIKDKQDGIFCGETLVYEMCKILNIQHKQIDSLICGFIR